MTRARRLLIAFYLAMAVVGAVVPYAILIPTLGEGWTLLGFLSGAFANPAAQVFAADLLISATVFMALVVVEGRRADMPRLWLYPLVAVTIGLCCALPLFLAMREIALTARAPSSPATA